MKFTRINERKKTNPKRGIVLVILLIIIVYLWMNAEGIVHKMFP